LFEKELKNQAQNYLEEYKQYISGLISAEGFAMNATMNLVQVDIPDNADDLLERFSGTKTVKTNRRRSSGNIDKRWWKPWTWLDEKYHTWNEEVATEKQIIKMRKLYEKWVEPQFKQFYKMIGDARSIAEKNAQGLKDFFTREIGRLDNALKEKVQEEEGSVRSKEAIEQKIRENRAKAEWLDKFILELNAILEV
jgi:hypothetical protein